jgi:hypothetical protein
MFEYKRPDREINLERTYTDVGRCFEGEGRDGYPMDPHEIMEDTSQLTMDVLIRWANTVEKCNCAQISYEVPDIQPTVPPTAKENDTIASLFPIPSLRPPKYHAHPYSGVMDKPHTMHAPMYKLTENETIIPPGIANHTNKTGGPFWPSGSKNFPSSFAEDPSPDDFFSKLDMVKNEYRTRTTCGALACMADALATMLAFPLSGSKGHCYRTVRPLCENLATQATNCAIEVPEMCTGLAKSKCVEAHHTLSAEEIRNLELTI